MEASKESTAAGARDATSGEESAAKKLQFKLYHFPSEWGLPSFEPASLEALTYLSLAGASCYCVPTNNPRISPSGQLPLLELPTGFVQHDRVVHYLRKNVKDLDRPLSASQRAELKAFKTMVNSTLEHARLHNWWVDEDNWCSVTEAAYSKAMGFPLNMLLPSRMRSSVVDGLHYRAGGGMSMGWGGAKAELVYNSAARAYDALAVRLGDELYFFPEHGYAPLLVIVGLHTIFSRAVHSATSLDACVFAHLVVHLYAPMPNHRLRIEAERHPNLVRFCDRIAKEAFGIQELKWEPVHVAAMEADEDRAASWTTYLYTLMGGAALVGLYLSTRSR